MHDGRPRLVAIMHSQLPAAWEHRKLLVFCKFFFRYSLQLLLSCCTYLLGEHTTVIPALLCNSCITLMDRHCRASDCIFITH